MSSTDQELGLQLPGDFPHRNYLKVWNLARRFQSDDAARIECNRQFGGAWNAVAYRFLLCSEADEASAKLIANHTGSIDHAIRAKLANNLFMFFVAGQATVESLAYAAHAMPAIFAYTGFCINTVEERRNVNLKLAGKQLTKAFHSLAIGSSLTCLATDRLYMRWEGLRNLLAHRLHPGEAIYVSAGGSPVADRHLYERLETPGPKGSAAHVEDVEINGKTTQQFRWWLTQKLAGLFAEVAELAEVLFGSLPDPP